MGDPDDTVKQEARRRGGKRWKRRKREGSRREVGGDV